MTAPRRLIRDGKERSPSLSKEREAQRKIPIPIPNPDLPQATTSQCTERQEIYVSAFVQASEQIKTHL